MTLHVSPPSPPHAPRGSRPPAAGMMNRSMVLLVGVVLVAVAKMAEAVLVPLAVAVLLTFVLMPVVHWLERLRVPRAAGATIVTLLVGLLAAGGVALITSQALDLIDQLPKYKSNLQAKVRLVKASAGEGTSSLKTLQETVEAVVETAKETPATTQATTQGATQEATTQAAVPVPTAASTAGLTPTPTVQTTPEAAAAVAGAGVVAGNVAGAAGGDAKQAADAATTATTPGGFDLFTFLTPIIDAASTVIGVLATAVVLLLFLLIEGDELARRAMHLARRWRIKITRATTEEAAERVGRYLRAQLIINSTYGAIMTVALLLVGLPNAVLWGFLTAVLRYVPYVGAWLAAILPVILSVAVFDSFMPTVIIVGCFLVAELVTNFGMEPWMFGSSTGVSSLGVILSSLFWTWVWGPWGLIMAVPITVVVVVLGRSVAGFQGIAFLLSNERIELSPVSKSAAADEAAAGAADEERMATAALAAVNVATTTGGMVGGSMTMMVRPGDDSTNLDEHAESDVARATLFARADATAEPEQDPPTNGSAPPASAR